MLLKQIKAPKAELHSKREFMVSRILITGGNGNLASHLVKEFRGDSLFVVYSPAKEELNISSHTEIKDYLNKNPIDCIIHAAAFTRPMAKHEKNPEISIQTNIIGTSLLAIECQLRSIKLIYISADYVYGLHSIGRISFISLLRE